jgi:uncharacterized membrane protein
MKAVMDPASLAAATAQPTGRFAIVDLARGVALLAMFVFHFAYDLSHFGLIETEIPADPAWRLFARLIAGSFLTLVGASLVLATRNGLNRRSFLMRFAMVAGAAVLVSVATFFAMPENFIFFGILHHVALASLLGLAFLRLPAWLVAATAALVFALPWYVTPDALDRLWLAWLGFAQHLPPAADFVPLFPWFGCVLTGIVLARLALPRLDGSALARWRPRFTPARLVAWGGRHSLLVYLVHQPLFIGALMLAMQTPLLQRSEEQRFTNSCERSCSSSARSTADCAGFCGCMLISLKREGLWGRETTPEASARTGALVQACLRGGS